MTDIDEQVITEYLNLAAFYKSGGEGGTFAYGYWVGRALEHADQNAVDRDWLVAALEQYGLDPAIVAVPKPGDPDARAN